MRGPDPERRARSGAGEIRPITADDRAALASFSCRSFGEPWSDVIEEMIREDLAHEIERSEDVVARGLWVDGQLVGVVAWRIDDASHRCQGLVLAVAIGHQRRGYARRLKLLEIEGARRAGARVVVSTVDWDNEAMLQVNASLGANIERIAGNVSQALCVIRT
jgi:hypothetical protein